MVWTALFYLLISEFTGFLFDRSVKTKNNNKRIFTVLSLAVPAFFAAIRFGIGTDYNVTYLPYFQYLNGTGGLKLYGRNDLELGFKLLNLIVIKLGGSFEVVMFVSSLITLFFYRLAVVRLSDKINVGLTTFLFMILNYQQSFNLVRQMIAMTIILFAWRYLIERNIKLFLLWVIIATSFHISALVVIPLYFTFNILTKKKYKYALILLYFAALYIAFNTERLNWLAIMFDKSGYYLAYTEHTRAFYFSLNLLLSILPYALVEVVMHKKIIIDKEMTLYANLFYFGCIFRLMAVMVANHADRISLYFLMPEIFFFTYVTKFYKKRLFWFAVTVISYALILFYWGFQYIYKGATGTVPYVTIFSR